MIADEIRSIQGSPSPEVNTSNWLQEIAAQLAELNQTLKQLTEMYRYS